MKQFLNVLRFEFFNIVKTKSFIITTSVLVLVSAVVLFFPRIENMVTGDAHDGDASNISESVDEAEGDGMTLAVLDPGNVLPGAAQMFASAMDCSAQSFEGSEEELKTAVADEEYDMALVLDGALKYRLIVKDLNMYDTTELVINEVLVSAYRAGALAQLGADETQITQILGAFAEGETVVTGTNQMENFFYTYLLLMLLYMAVLIYGQMVSQSVAAEKSSRAMELLITSAKPSSLMFGKVLGVGIAGLLQMVCVLGSLVVFYSVNKGYWGDNQIINSLFGIPPMMLFYTILFFLTGYFIFAFMFGAAGSLASRLEDVSSLAMPITFVFIITFMIAIFSITSGSLDSVLIKVCSFFPLTAPMIMFVRIAMSDVEVWEIVLSVVLQIAAVIGIGYLSAGIYRAGVLLYGKPPKPIEVLRLLRSNKK